MKISAADNTNNDALDALRDIANECSMRPNTGQTNAGIDEAVTAEQWEEKIIRIRQIAMKAIRAEMAKAQQ